VALAGGLEGCPQLVEVGTGAKHPSVPSACRGSGPTTSTVASDGSGLMETPQVGTPVLRT